MTFIASFYIQRHMLASLRSAWLLLLPLVLTPPSAAAEDLPLFQDDEILQAVLTAPIAQAYARKLQEPQIYFPGSWSYVGENGESAELDVSIRTRGNFRRQHCDLAPLRLNFKKSQVKGTLFAGQDKLKLVAPCFDSPRYQSYVILEYLAYKTLQILTDHSYRTRLIRLSYIDSDEKLPPWTAMAFVIEDDADMADRLGLERIRVPSVDFAELDREKTALAELFQLLIGNNDYSVLEGEDGEDCCHNSDVLAIDETLPKIPIPFDFDFSGLVNAPYATPPHHLHIKNVRYRHYTGLCHPPGILEAAIAHVQSKRGEVMALFENTAELSAEDRSAAVRYVGVFFDMLDSPGRVKRLIVGRCRGKHLLKTMLQSSEDQS
jgi:hypothetical protein